MVEPISLSSDPQVFFGALAALIFLGFLGSLVFSRLRINDTLLLIGVGVVLGPVLGLIDPAPLARISLIVGPLALILILFDGGLALRFHELLHGLGGALVLALLGFALTAVLVGAITWLLLPGVTPLTGLILGAILGGTSALVVMPSLAHMRTEKRTAAVLSLESALTDVLVVVVSFTLIAVAAARAAASTAAPGADDLATTLVLTFGFSLFLGLVAGIIWLFTVPRVQGKPYSYMLTLGVMFLLYVLVEWLLRDVSSGGGPLAVLAFGIMLGNGPAMGARMRERVGDEFGSGMKKFQGEIAFLVRTFFFVYLGVIVDIRLLGDPYILAVGTLLFAAMLLARYIVVSLLRRNMRLAGDAAVIWVMMPRGLAAAVLAAIPASQHGLPGTEPFVALAFMMLVLSNLVATVGPFVLERRTTRGSAQRAGRQ